MTEFFKNILSVELHPELHDITHHSILKNTYEHTQIFPDEILDSVFFVRSGVVRSYYVRDDGTEFTEWLFSKGDIIFSPDGLFYDRLPHITLQALTSTLLVKLKKADYFAFRKKYRFFEEVTKLLESNLDKKQREYRESKELLFNDDLYAAFADKYPHIVSQIKGKHLALFLGVTPPMLSRMKRNYRENSKS